MLRDENLNGFVVSYESRFASRTPEPSPTHDSYNTPFTRRFCFAAAEDFESGEVRGADCISSGVRGGFPPSFADVSSSGEQNPRENNFFDLIKVAQLFGMRSYLFGTVDFAARGQSVPKASSCS